MTVLWSSWAAFNWQKNGATAITPTVGVPTPRGRASVEDILRRKISPRIDQHSPDAQKRELLMYGRARFNADRLIKRGHCLRRTCRTGTEQSSSGRCRIVRYRYDMYRMIQVRRTLTAIRRISALKGFTSSTLVFLLTLALGGNAVGNLVNSNYHFSSSLLLGFPQN